MAPSLSGCCISKPDMRSVLLKQLTEGVSQMTDVRLRRGFPIPRLAGAAVLSALVLLAAACGGGDDDSGNTATTVGPNGTTVTSAPGGTAAPGALEDQTFTIGQHFWHSGFRVEVTEGEIVSSENALSGRVSISLNLSATFENLGSDTGYFGPPVAIVTADNSYTETIQSELSDVGGGLKSQGSLTFRIDDGFDLSSAELLVGSADENQARIPLRASGDAVRLEPSEPAISGTLSMELIDLTFTSATLTYDNPERHREVAKGKQLLTLNFDALSRKGGNWQIFATDFSLVDPAGVAIAADASEIGSLPGSEAGAATTDRNVQFLVDEMVTGDFTLRLTPGSWFVGDDGVTEATFEFSLG